MELISKEALGTEPQDMDTQVRATGPEGMGDNLMQVLNMKLLRQPDLGMGKVAMLLLIKARPATMRKVTEVKVTEALDIRALQRRP